MNREREAELRQWIDAHEEELVRDIRKLVRIPSVSRPEQERSDDTVKAAHCMMEIAAQYGLHAENCEDCCVKILYGAGENEVQVWGHLDVVPAGGGWIYPPWECTRKGDFLIGRGVSDNKGAVIAVLYCLRYLKEHNIKPCFRISQICGLSEETGMADAAWYLTKWPAPDFAFVSDCRFPLCYGEKGRCVLTLKRDSVPDVILDMSAGEASNSVPAEAVICIDRSAHMGDRKVEALQLGMDMREELSGNTVRYTVKGIPGHAAAPDRCVNPIGLAGMLLKDGSGLKPEEKHFLEFFQTACLDGYGKGLGIASSDPVFEKLTCAGTVLEMKNRTVTLTMDIRYQPSVNAADIVKQVQKTAGLYGFVLSAEEHRDGYCDSIDSEEVKALLSAYDHVVKDGKKPYVMGGNTYAGMIPNAVCFGPGIPKDYSELELPAGHGGGHGCDEIQSISSLKKAMEVYVHAFMNLNDLYEKRSRKEERD